MASNTKFSFIFFIIIYQLNKTFQKMSAKCKVFIFLLFIRYPNFTNLLDKKVLPRLMGYTVCTLYSTQYSVQCTVGWSDSSRQRQVHTKSNMPKHFFQFLILLCLQDLANFLSLREDRCKNERRHLKSITAKINFPQGIKIIIQNDFFVGIILLLSLLQCISSYKNHVQN